MTIKQLIIQTKASTLFSKKGWAKLSAFALLFATIALFLIFFYYRAPIKVFAKNAVETVGYPAVFFFCMIADTIIQPIPGDVVVFGTAFGGASIWTTSLIAGIASACGGTAGYFVGKLFGPWRFRRIFGSRLLRAGRDLFRDHGSLAIFVAGVSPIPYSATCWIGGIYNMSLTKVIIASLISRTLRYLAVAWFGSMV